MTYMCITISDHRLVDSEAGTAGQELVVLDYFITLIEPKAKSLLAPSCTVRHWPGTGRDQTAAKAFIVVASGRRCHTSSTHGGKCAKYAIQTRIVRRSTCEKLIAILKRR